MIIYWKHFKTITKHKWYVMKACFKVGLIWQGITHDLSKYSITEFITSARNFQGDKSPIDAERARKGYSLAWQHHKGHNKHHWQYWTDFSKGELVILEMPPKYVAEMLCDWVGAGKAYNKSSWTIDSFKNWYEDNKNKIVIHALTRSYIELVMEHVKTEKELYSHWFIPNVIASDYALVQMQGGAYQPRYKLIDSILEQSR